MRRLAINWLDLELAFEPSPDDLEMEYACYFDLEKGELFVVDEELRQIVDNIMEEIKDLPGEDADWGVDAVRGTDEFQRVSEGEQARVLAAIELELGDASRFAAVPRFESRESYGHMQEFVETVADRAMQTRLCDAIAQRKPFRRFRDALAGDRRLERRWQEFEVARRRETMIEWLHSVGVEPANPREMTYDPPPFPELRKIMLDETLWFVRAARGLEGVRRIALIGSLTTDKEFPKDIDLLITISDDCDLEPLARLGRRLEGLMTNHQAGADVFLANEQEHHLGRTCPWKNCGPGYRVRCDALHCGRRPYLHDDLRSIRLERPLIIDPPVLLWPVLAAKEAVPRDVRERLIDKLAEDLEG